MYKLSSFNPWRERTSGGFSRVKQLTNPRAGLLAPAESVAMVTSDQDAQQMRRCHSKLETVNKIWKIQCQEISEDVTPQLNVMVSHDEIGKHVYFCNRLLDFPPFLLIGRMIKRDEVIYLFIYLAGCQKTGYQIECLNFIGNLRSVYKKG